MGRLTHAVAGGLLCVLAFQGAASGRAATGVTWTVGGNPVRVTISAQGKTLLQEDAAAGLRYQLASTGEQHSLTSVIATNGDTYTVATDEPGRTATLRVDARGTGVEISVTLSPSDDVAAVYDAFDTAPTDHFMGGGERGTSVDLRGQILPVKVSSVCTYAPAPFFVSSAGYGLRLDTDHLAGLAFPGSPGGRGCAFGQSAQCSFPPLPERVEVCAEGAQLDEDVYVGSPAQAVAAYTADTGRAAVPPLSELALVKWRDVVSNQQDLLDDADRLKAAGIPDGWVVLDNPWETCGGSLQFDPSRIPDPAGLISQLHSRGVKLMLWVSPNVNCSNGAGYPASGLVPNGSGKQLDLSQPAVEAQFESRLRAVLSLGVDGVKGDRADEVDSSTNDYPMLFARAVVNVLQSLHGNDFATIFRAASPGEQALVHGFWGGDQPGDFTGLQRAIHQGASAGIVGMSVWGSDIGGYSSAGLTPEVFARWAQFGAVSPVFEVGGTGPNATPWVMGQGALDSLRAAAVLHYELVPYFMSLVQKGLPVLRPLAYAYPADAAAWSSDYELMVGPSLLAAPVTDHGTTPSVYLPRGRWIDLYTGRAVTGPATFTRPTPLDQFPLYVRAGSTVPFNLRTARASWWGLNELQHRGRMGFLTTSGALVNLTHLTRSVQLFVPSPQPPLRVSFRGKRVRWTWNAGPLPGVVVRLRGPSLRGRVVLAAA